MAEQDKKPDDKRLLDLLGMGYLADGDDDGFADADADDGFPGDEDEGDYWLPRPEWLHPDCRNVCSALELGTCCKYPDNPLVRVAVELADATERVIGRLGEVSCARSGAELAGRFQQIPGLLAQVHALLPRLSQTARAQLLCPVGALAGALDAACGDGCPWACDDPAAEDPRAHFRVMIELVAECSAAIRTSLDGPGRDPVMVRPRPPRD